MCIVSFVILHYKDYESTDRCVQSVLWMECQERVRIVIVDNDIDKSPQERDRGMQRYRTYRNTAILRIEENGGFSYANNLGYAYAREKQKADFILLLNNDIEFLQPDFLRRLDAVCTENDCHVLGPDVVHGTTGEHQNPMDIRLRTEEEAAYTVRMNRRALRWYSLLYPLLYWNNIRMRRAQTRKRLTGEACQSVQEDIIPCGACLIFTPEFVRQEEKALVPETRFFYEEYLLALRCRRKEYRIIYTPALQVLHESGAATRRSYHSEKQRLKFQMERTAEAAEIYLEALRRTSSG